MLGNKCAEVHAKQDRDCISCAYSTIGDGNGNGCKAWACEYISRQEAIEAYKESRKPKRAGVFIEGLTMPAKGESREIIIKDTGDVYDLNIKAAGFLSYRNDRWKGKATEEVR